MLPAGMHEHGGKDGDDAMLCPDIGWNKRPVINKILAAEQFQDKNKYIDADNCQSHRWKMNGAP
jgi:hypothetical protein